MLTKQKGFSIVEVLIASTMLLSLVAFFTYFGGRNKQKIISTSDKQCIEIAEELMNKLRGIGFEKEVVQTDNVHGNFQVDTDQDTIDFAPEGNQLNGIDDQPIIRQNSGQYYMENYKGIVGIMSFLSDLYNNEATVRNQPGYDTSLLSSTFFDTANAEGTLSDRLRNITNRIVIRPYNLTTNTPVSLAPPVKIRPPGANNNPSGGLAISADAPNVLPDPQSRNNIGFLVSINTSYQNIEGVTSQCGVSTMFRYPIARVPKDFENPSTLINATVTLNNGTSAACAAQNTVSNSTLNINFGGIADLSNKNYIFLCSDQAQIDGAFPATLLTCADSATRAVSSELTNNSDWVPCHTVTLCGVPPANSVRGPTSLTVYYNGTMPWGCHAQVAIRIVDAALNTTQNSFLSTGGTMTENRSCLPCPSPPYAGGEYCDEPATHCESGGGGGGSTDGQDGGEGDGGDGGGGGGGSVDGSNGH